MIEGVYLKELITHSDNRGFFRELIRYNDEYFGHGFGQLSHSLVLPGITKAWHGHIVQTQWNYIVNGNLRVVLFDDRPASPTYTHHLEILINAPEVPVLYAFPPGVLHGYCCFDTPMNIIYLTSGTYDLDDEVRIQQDEPRLLKALEILTQPFGQ